jgi:hypothetical protein
MCLSLKGLAELARKCDGGLVRGGQDGAVADLESGHSEPAIVLRCLPAQRDRRKLNEIGTRNLHAAKKRKGRKRTLAV